MHSKEKGQKQPRKSDKHAKVQAVLGGVAPTEAVIHAAVNKTARASKAARRRPNDEEVDGARGAGVSGWSLATEGETVLESLDPNDGATGGARGAGVSGWSLATEGETVLESLDPNDGATGGARGAGVSGWSLATEGETVLESLDPNDGATGGARGAGVSGWSLATEGETALESLDPNDGETDGARGAGVSGWSLATEGETVLESLDPNDGETDGDRGAGVSGWSLATEGETVLKNLDRTMVVNVNVQPEGEQSGNRRFIVNVRPSLMKAVNKGPGLEQSERGRSMSARPGGETSAIKRWGDVKSGAGQLTEKPSDGDNVPGVTNSVPEMGGPEVIIPCVEEAGGDGWNYIGGYQTTYAAVIGTDRRFIRDGRVDAGTEPKSDAMPPTSSAEPYDSGKVQPELRRDTQADDNVRMLPEQGSVFTSLQGDTGEYLPGDPQPVQADEIVAQTSKQRCFSETSSTALTPAHRQRLLHKARRFLAKFHRGRQEANDITTEPQEDETNGEAVPQTGHSRRTVSAHAGMRTRSESRKRNREYDNKSNIGTPAMKKGRQSVEPMDTTEKPSHRSKSLCRIPSTPMEHDGEDGPVRVSEHPPRKSRDRRNRNQIERSKAEARLASAGDGVIHQVVSNTKSLSPMECEIPHAEEKIEAVSELPYIIIDYDDLFTHDETGETEMWRREHVMSWKRDESTATSELEATGDASTYDSERVTETEDDESNIQSVQDESLGVLGPPVLLPTDELLEETNLFEILGSGIQPDQEAEVETWTDARTLSEWSDELKIMFSPRRERDPMLTERRDQQQRRTPLKDGQTGGPRDLYVMKRAEIDFKRVNDSCDVGNSPGGSEVSSPAPGTTVQSRGVRTPPDMIPIRVDTVLETEEELPPTSSSSDEYEGQRRRRQRRTAEHRRRRRTELCLRRDEHVVVLKREASAKRETGATRYTIREANVASGVDLVTNTNSISGGSEDVDQMDVTTNQRGMSRSAPPTGGGHDGNGAGGGETEDGSTSPELDGGSAGMDEPVQDDGIVAEAIGTDFTDDAARDAYLDEMRAAEVKRSEGNEPLDGGPQTSGAEADVMMVLEIKRDRPTLKTTSPGPSTSEKSRVKAKESWGRDEEKEERRSEEKMDESDAPRTDARTPPYAMTSGILDGGNKAPITTVKVSDVVYSPKRAARTSATVSEAKREHSDVSNGQEVREDGESTPKTGRTTAEAKQGNEVAMTDAIGSGYRQGASSMASASTVHQRDLTLSDAGGDNDLRSSIFSPRSDSDYDSLQQPHCSTQEPRPRIPQMNSGIITRTKNRMVFMMKELDREMDMAVRKAKYREGEVKRRKIVATKEQLTEDGTRDVVEFRRVMRELLHRGYQDMKNLVESADGTSISRLGRQVTTSLTVRTEDGRSTPSISSPLTTNSLSSTAGDGSRSHLTRSGASSGSYAGTSASTHRDESLTPGDRHDTTRGSGCVRTHKRERSSWYEEEEEEDDELDESSQEGMVAKSREGVPEPSNEADEELDFEVTDDEEFSSAAKDPRQTGASKHDEEQPASEAEDESDDDEATTGSHKRHQQEKLILPISKDYLLPTDEYHQRLKNRLRETNHSSPLHQKKRRTVLKGVQEPVTRLTPRRPVVPTLVLSEDKNRDGAVYLWETTNRKDAGTPAAKITTEAVQNMVKGATDEVYVEMTCKWAGRRETGFPLDPISKSRPLDDDATMLDETRISQMALKRGYLIPESERDTRRRMKLLLQKLLDAQGTTKLRLPRTLAGVYECTEEAGFGLRAAKYWYSLTRMAITLWGEKAVVDTREETMRFEEQVLELTKRRRMVLPMDIAKFLTEGEKRLRDATIDATEGLCETEVEKEIQNTAMTFVHGAQLRLSRRLKQVDSPAQYVHGMVRLPLNEHSCIDDKELLDGINYRDEFWEHQMKKNRRTSYQFGVVQRIIRWVWWNFKEYKRLVEDNRYDGAELNPRTAQILHLSHWPQQMFDAYAEEIREVIHKATDMYIQAGDEGATREKVLRKYNDTELTEAQKKDKRELSRKNQKEVASAYVGARIPVHDTPVIEQPPVPPASSVAAVVRRPVKERIGETKEHLSTSHRSGTTSSRLVRDGVITTTVENTRARKGMEAGTSSGRSGDRPKEPPTGFTRTIKTSDKGSRDVARPPRSISANTLHYRDLSRISKTTGRDRSGHKERTDRKRGQASSSKGSSR